MVSIGSIQGGLKKLMIALAALMMIGTAAGAMNVGQASAGRYVSSVSAFDGYCRHIYGGNAEYYWIKPLWQQCRIYTWWGNWWHLDSVSPTKACKWKYGQRTFATRYRSTILCYKY